MLLGSFAREKSLAHHALPQALLDLKRLPHSVGGASSCTVAKRLRYNLAECLFQGDLKNQAFTLLELSRGIYVSPDSGWDQL